MISIGLGSESMIYYYERGAGQIVYSPNRRFYAQLPLLVGVLFATDHEVDAFA